MDLVVLLVTASVLLLGIIFLIPSSTSDKTGIVKEAKKKPKKKKSKQQKETQQTDKDKNVSHVGRNKRDNQNDDDSDNDEENETKISLNSSHKLGKSQKKQSATNGQPDGGAGDKNGKKKKKKGGKTGDVAKQNPTPAVVQNEPAKSKAKRNDLVMEATSSTSDDAGDWVAVQVPKKKKPKAQNKAVQKVGGGNVIDLGTCMAAVIGKGGETIKRIQEESGARLDITKGSSICTISSTKKGDAGEAAITHATEAVQKILSEQQERMAGMDSVVINVGNKAAAIIGKGGSTIKKIMETAPGAKLDIDRSDDGSNARVTISGERAAVKKARKIVETILEGGLLPGEVSKKIDLGSLNNKFVLIGPGGATIRQLQASTNAKLDMPRDQNVVTISGEPDAVTAATTAVRALLAEHNHSALVPIGDLVGTIIGEGGSTIRELQDETGARLNIKDHVAEGISGKAVSITGTEKQVAAAKKAVEALLEKQTAPPEIAEGEVLETLSIPATAIGGVIGKGGSNISLLQDEHGATVDIPRGTTICYIYGAPSSVEQTKEAIQEIIDRFNKLDAAKATAAAGGLLPDDAGNEVLVDPTAGWGTEADMSESSGAAAADAGSWGCGDLAQSQGW